MTVGAYATPEYLALPGPETPFVIDQVLPVGGLLSIYGPPKLGKSYLALQLTAAITGEADDWLGYRVRQRGPVLYVQLDTPRSLWQGEHCRHLKAAGFPLEHVYHADRLSLPWPFDVLEEASQDALRALVEAIEPLAVVIDTLREAHSGDEDKSGPAKVAIAAMTSCIGQAAGIYVGHSRKPGEHGIGSPVHGMRGSSYVPGRMDTIVQCSEGRLKLSGRAIRDTTLPTYRDPYIWHLRDGDEMTDAEADAIGAVLLDERLESDRERARELARILHRPEGSCRHLLRRARE